MQEDKTWTRYGPFIREPSERAEERTIGARELYEIFRRRFWLTAAIVSIGTVASVLLTGELPKTYTAHAMIVVEPDNPNPLDNAQTPSPTQQPDKSRMDTEADLITSRVFAGVVVDTLGLLHDPDFNPYLPERPGAASDPGPFARLVSMAELAASNAIALVVGQADDKTPPPDLGVQHDAAVTSFLGRLSVDRTGESSAMTISFSDDDAPTTAHVANETARLFVAWSRENKRGDVRDTVRLLQRQSEDLTSQIAEIERQITQYAAAHGVSSDPRDDLLRASIQQNNEQLSAAQGDLTQARAKLAQVKLAAASGGAAASTDPLLSSDFLTSLRNDEATALRDRAQLAGNFGRNHPLVQEADAKVKTVQGLISQEMQRIVANLENDVRVNEGRVAQLTKSLAVANEELRQRSLAEAKLREYDNNLQTVQKLYDLISGRLGSLSPFLEAVEPGVRVVSLAALPTSASFPKLRMMVAGGFIGSLVLSFILVLTLESLDRRVRDPRRVSRILNAPMLSAIPKLPRRFFRRASAPLDALLHQPQSAFSDAFRSLYDACVRMNLGRNKQTILVSSALPREGKTTTAMGLAVTAALDGARTVLIDLDLRTRNLNKALKLGPAQKTLNDYLRGACDLDDILQTIPAVPLLHVVAQSPHDRESPAFLSSGQLAALLAAAQLRYDFVIIDAPPILVIEDAIRIAASVDTVVLVAASGRTTAEALSQTSDRLQLAGEPLVGWVFNRVNPFRQPHGRLRRSYFRRAELRRHFPLESETA